MSTKLFTDEEVFNFEAKILAHSDDEAFKEFYDRCVMKAKAAVLFNANMNSDHIVRFISTLNEPQWGKIDPLTPQQIALVRLVDAVCQEIFDMMVEDLLKKKQTTKPN